MVSEVMYPDVLRLHSFFNLLVYPAQECSSVGRAVQVYDLPFMLVVAQSSCNMLFHRTCSSADHDMVDFRLGRAGHDVFYFDLGLVGGAGTVGVD